VNFKHSAFSWTRKHHTAPQRGYISIQLQTVTSQQKSGLLFPVVRNSHIKHCNISDPLTFPRATYMVPKANLPFIIIVKPNFLRIFGVVPRKCLDSTECYNTTASFQILFNRTSTMPYIKQRNNDTVTGTNCLLFSSLHNVHFPVT